MFQWFENKSQKLVLVYQLLFSLDLNQDESRTATEIAQAWMPFFNLDKRKIKVIVTVQSKGGISRKNQFRNKLKLRHD